MSRPFSVSLLSLFAVGALSGCLSLPQRVSSQAPAAGTVAGAGSVSATRTEVSTPTVAEREAARREELSKNDARVNFRVSCEGLFIPQVTKTMFQNVIPVWSMRVINNSQNRYVVKYDLTLRQRTRNVITNSVSQFTEEREFIVRAGQYVGFDLAKQGSSTGVSIEDVAKIEVLSCTKS